MDFLFKKQRHIEALIYKYVDSITLVQENFLKALNIYFDKGPGDREFDFMVEETHKTESRSDDLRYEIETMMYAKALIPESRGDILELMEATDNVPNQFELVLYMIQTQRLCVPEFIVIDIKDLVKVSLEICTLLVEEIKALFSESDKIDKLVSSIDQKESHGDHIERRIITKLFDSDLDTAQKILLKELILEIGEIADLVDVVSRRISIINIKRKV